MLAATGTGRPTVFHLTATRPVVKVGADKTAVALQTSRDIRTGCPAWLVRHRAMTRAA